MKKVCAVVFVIAICSCNKGGDASPPVPPTPETFTLTSIVVNGQPLSPVAYAIPLSATIRLKFSAPVQAASAAAIQLLSATSVAGLTTSLEQGDSTVVVSAVGGLQPLTKYTLSVTADLRSRKGTALQAAYNSTFVSAIDSSDKFPRIGDEALLTLVQRQHFRFFWEYGHPVSGMARDRNANPDLVTSGGTGMGVMAIVAAIHRNFITRTEGLARIEKIVNFLRNNTQKYHGAFAHFINGSTGATIPFSTKDNGGDLVETALLMQGLLTARQYFNAADVQETSLRAGINELWNGVDWSWYRKGGEEVLYWHWSPDYQWDINLKISGWNEALIVYLLAASSPANPIPKSVYDAGWARNGAIRNNATYFGVPLPLGPPQGGPLFFAHYSFLGLDPNGLSDAYANYWDQNVAHTKINYRYSVANPKGWNGYSEAVWGLTASDNNSSGYAAHEPANDLGIISPTAALSSMPYTPAESMAALKFFYYTLGDKTWKEYGFVDAFNLSNPWFAPSHLAIDQGPIIIMIENHRSGLLWDLFMSAPEIKQGLTRLGFASPHL
ncbi:MAG TPA: glucoamylase family protein [Flavisolibacter sp.]